MNYEKPFDCKNCPERNDEKGCPAWMELVFEQLNSNEVKIVKDCGWKLMPVMLVEVIKTSNRPAAAVESCRNEIVNGFVNLTGAIKQMPLMLREAHAKDDS